MATFTLFTPHLSNQSSPEKKLVAAKSEAIATYYLTYHLRKSVERQKLQGLPNHYLNPPQNPPELELYIFIVKICTEIESKDTDYFNNLPTSMNLQVSNAKTIYKSLCKIVLTGVINWGRVLSLFTLAGTFAVHFTKLGQLSIVIEMPQWISEVIETELADWIMEQGGWDDAKKQLSRTKWPSVTWSQIVAYGAVAAKFLQLGNGDDQVNVGMGTTTSPDRNHFKYTFPDNTDGKTNVQESSPQPGLEVYSMELEWHGECIIFSNEFMIPVELDNGQYLKRRIGTEQDIVSLTDTFEWLGFEVKVYRNKSGVDTLEILSGISSQKKQANDDCFVCCILSHGYNGGFYSSDGTMVPTEKIKKIFEADRCPSLRNKPKLFLIQACQGEDYGKGTKLETDSPCMAVENEEAVSTHADFLFFIASTPGTVSWRDPRRGSWFVQTLCRIFQKNASNYSLMDMSIIINKEIAFKSEQTQKNEVAKQMSHYDSTMTKKFFFNPKCDFKKHLQKQLSAWES